MIDILVCMGCYRTGHDATGPNQSLKAMMAALSDFARFSVLAELAPEERGEGRAATDWIEDGLCRTRRLAPRRIGADGLAATMRETPHDILVVTSLFDPVFSIGPVLLRRAGSLPSRPAILAPRGELSPGALSIRPRRKRAYLALAARLRLHDDLWLHATGPAEARDIRRALPASRGLLEAANPANALTPSPHRPATGEPVLRIAFLSRIAPLKNLLFVLDVLARAAIPVRLDVMGPKVDPHYWERCRRAIAALPPHVTARDRGEIARSDIAEALADQDLFFLPSLGENFSHAILEALTCGVPALLSDRTPWRDLEAHGAGWDLPLETPEAFVGTIQGFARLGEAERARLRAGAHRLALRHRLESDAAGAHRRMFETVLAAAP